MESLAYSSWIVRTSTESSSADAFSSMGLVFFLDEMLPVTLDATLDAMEEAMEATDAPEENWDEGPRGGGGWYGWEDGIGMILGVG